MHKTSWDDLRYILSVAEYGSVASAARALGVNHSTVLRHVNAFENQHKVRLFERLASGYRLTEEGADVAASLREVRDGIHEMQRRISGRELRLEGSLRMTTTDSVLLGALGPHVASFRRAYPRITLEVVLTVGRLDIGRREADVAVRPSAAPPETLVATRVAGFGFGVYASAGYLAEHAAASLTEHTWLGLDASLRDAPPARWLRQQVPEEAIVLRADSFVALGQAAQEGLGVSLLPCCYGEKLPGLERLHGPVEALEVSLWVLTHRDLRRSAIVNAFVEHFVTGLRADRRLLEGGPR